MPKVVFIGFGLAALLCLLLGNAALFAWFIIRKRSKGLTQFSVFNCVFSSFFCWIIMRLIDFVFWLCDTHTNTVWLVLIACCVCACLNMSNTTCRTHGNWAWSTFSSDISIQILNSVWMLYVCVLNQSFDALFTHPFVSAFYADFWYSLVCMWHIGMKGIKFYAIFLFSLATDFQTFIVPRKIPQTFLINFGLLRCTIVI